MNPAGFRARKANGKASPEVTEVTEGELVRIGRRKSLGEHRLLPCKGRVKRGGAERGQPFTYDFRRAPKWFAGERSAQR
jgi:hypothetical protein